MAVRDIGKAKIYNLQDVNKQAFPKKHYQHKSLFDHVS